MTPVSLPWDINPLVFLEFFFVLAFAIGWLVLEWVANRPDRAKKREAQKARDDAGGERP